MFERKEHIIVLKRAMNLVDHDVSVILRSFILHTFHQLVPVSQYWVFIVEQWYFRAVTDHLNSFNSALDRKRFLRYLILTLQESFLDIVWLLWSLIMRRV